MLTHLCICETPIYAKEPKQQVPNTLTNDSDSEGDPLPDSTNKTNNRAHLLSQSSLRAHSQGQNKQPSPSHSRSSSRSSIDSTDEQPFQDAQSIHQENGMPPKQPSSAKKAKQVIKAKEARIAELQAQLAEAQSQVPTIPRGGSPSEQVNLANAIAQSSSKKAKRRKSSGANDPQDHLSDTKEMIESTVKEPVWALIKFVTGDFTVEKLASYVLRYGSPVALPPKKRAEWYSTFGPPCVSRLNSHKSTVSSNTKSAFFDNWKKQNKGWAEVDYGHVSRYENCLKRQIDLNNPENLND